MAIPAKPVVMDWGCIIFTFLKKVSPSEKKIVFLHRGIAVFFLTHAAKPLENSNLRNPLCHTLLTKTACQTLVINKQRYNGIIMKQTKQSYQQPIMKVAAFRVEDGYASLTSETTGTNNQEEAIQSLTENSGSRLFYSAFE